MRLKRNRMCGTLRPADIGSTVCLMGWVAKERNLGALIFIDLRDTTGISQVVVTKEQTPALYEIAETVRGEFVIAVEGIVRERESKNPNLPTGTVEVLASDFQILDRAQTPPIYVRDEDNASETMRLKYRFLDLRKEQMQNNLKIRTKAAKAFRDFLYEHDFIEVETPVLTKPTPEGARDYLVPSRVNPHEFYALPQSPQLLKQILMISGMDRYYQIVKCFRDEDLRANRQPEFTQVDIEMSFVDMEDVIGINERLIAHLFREIKGVEIPLPIRRMTYGEAMRDYGVDKPDLRFGFLLKDLEDIFADTDFVPFANALEAKHSIRGFQIGEHESAYSRKKIDKLVDFVKDYGVNSLFWIKFHEGEMSSSMAKFLTPVQIDALKERFEIDQNGLILMAAGEYERVCAALGNLRVHLAQELELLDNQIFEMTWITDFPLFEYDEDEARYVAKHHPFTKPVEEDIPLLKTNPKAVRAMAYDIVINGDEMGGGSIRINNSDLQNTMFEALGLSQEDIENKFGFFIEALKYGTPPHGGIAYGFDRLVMLLVGTNNIKDVIAFPKTQSATCLMSGAPSKVDEKQLKEAHIKLDA